MNNKGHKKLNRKAQHDESSNVLIGLVLLALILITIVGITRSTRPIRTLLDSSC
jgi:hypothetical protein